MLKIHQNYTLRNNHTFGTDIASAYFTEPSSVEELVYALEYTGRRSIESFIVGEGSNLLFTHTYKGLIIHPVITGIEKMDESSTEVLVKTGAGVNWDAFVSHCILHGWHGIENLSLIPGSTGAAPVQNIGAYGVEAKDLIEYVEVLDTETLSSSTLSNAACEFGYRDSIFKHSLHNRYIVTAVVFRLQKKFEPVLDYGNIKQVFGEKSRQDASALRESVISIRKSKLPDPADTGNAGSFFKNPVIDQVLFQKLKDKWEQIPHYPSGKQNIKLPAAWLIEQAGWKGIREGDVGTWPLQPLVIVNYGQASGQEIFGFSEKIRNSIREKFGIDLEREVTLVS